MVALSGFLFLASAQPRPLKAVIDESLQFSVSQSLAMAKLMKSMPARLPRTLDASGKLVTSNSAWWTSGFFPGVLWYLYEYSGDTALLNAARMMTERVRDQQYTTDNHDVGFMLYCSFGNGLRLTGNDDYKKVLLRGAESLGTRFRPRIGCIQSWNADQRWQCPVIIDNMMNLELLFWASRESGDSKFRQWAVSHADTTMKNHFRPDYSTWHVIAYNPETGAVAARKTAQGFADESAWARGQSWGLYGYTMSYRDTRDPKYLTQACRIADFLTGHPRMPEDGIPYWDYDAPDIPNALRDVSAGAIMASALVELSQLVEAPLSAKYLAFAEKQIRSMASPRYRATMGANGNFILMHSVGNIPSRSEVDVPLTYADYYFVEALMRLRKLPGNR